MVNLLFSNDKQGVYPQSWYAATATPLDRFAPLEGETRADVCVIGAGFTGLSAALHLAEAGRDVVLLDAHRVGFGASGRNGGQLGSGQRVDQIGLESRLGKAAAKTLWDLGEEAKTLIRNLIERHQIDCDLKPGVAWTDESDKGAEDLRRYAGHMADRYGYDKITWHDCAAFSEICPSPAYRGGIVDHGAGHLHPLKLSLGLARAVRDAGVRIHEGSEVHRVEPGPNPVVRTTRGLIKAETVILAGNGYLGGLDRKVAARVMPINNFIVATEPLGDLAGEVLRQDIAVADGRFVINYFRLSHDGRLLFGGGESYGYRFPRDIEAVVRKPMLEIFPSLADAKIDFAWGGTLAITMPRLPYLSRVAPNVLSSSGYSGHGVGTATHCGQLLAQAVIGQSDGFYTFSTLPIKPFPGGSAFRTPLLALAMTWYRLRDRLGV